MREKMTNSGRDSSVNQGELVTQVNMFTASSFCYGKSFSNDSDDDQPKNSTISVSNSTLTMNTLHRSEENDILIVNNVSYHSFDETGNTNNGCKSLCNKRKVDIRREIIDWNDLNLKYGRVKRTEKRTQLVTSAVKKYCANFSLLNNIVNLFPILTWIRIYSIRDYLLCDVIAGFTILILHIPQGMAYGILSGLGAINGLYVSFFPVIIYSLMGTSRHISIGTFAVVSIMCRNAALKVVTTSANTDVVYNTTLLYNSTDVEHVITNLDAQTTICVITGICQVILGLCHMGSLSVILSDTLVSAFTTGCAIHVATAQLPSLFDITLPTGDDRNTKIPFKLIETWVLIIERLAKTNLATLCVAIIGILTLIAVKEFIEPKLRKRFTLAMPIPIDIILVIGVTLFSWLLNLEAKRNVRVIGDVPTGLPIPKLPRLDYSLTILSDSVVIAIVTFAVSLSIAKIYAKKEKYRLDDNQELLALGSANIFSSFFACYPSTGSLSRSAVQHKVGGKTQIAGLVSSLLMLIFLLFLGPLVYHLPRCVLSCIVLVALKSMFMQVTDVAKLCKISILEASQWLVTFVCVVLLGVDLGLVVGVVYSIVIVLLRFSLPESTLTGRLPLSEIYVDCEQYCKARQVEGIKIFRFSCALFFLNCQIFARNLYSSALNITNDSDDNNTSDQLSVGTVHTVIIDCSSIFYIDSAGVDTLCEIISELKCLGVSVTLASCPHRFLSMLETTDFFSRVKCPQIYATVHDAVVQCVHQ